MGAPARPQTKPQPAIEKHRDLSSFVIICHHRHPRPLRPPRLPVADNDYYPSCRTPRNPEPRRPADVTCRRRHRCDRLRAFVVRFPPPTPAALCLCGSVVNNPGGPPPSDRPDVAPPLALRRDLRPLSGAPPA
jgi:hypothetical protein